MIRNKKNWNKKSLLFEEQIQQYTAQANDKYNYLNQKWGCAILPPC